MAHIDTRGPRQRPWRPKRGLALLALFALLFLTVQETWARGGFRGGGFRSGGSYRSFSLPRSTSPSTGGIPGWGSRTPKTTGPATAPRLSGSGSARTAGGLAAQRSLYETARSKGTLFNTRDEATASFSRNFGSTYTSKFAAEPAARPSWIPATTAVGGRSLPVSYVPSLGGYGYLDPLLGTWILYDALSDAVMLSTLMGNHGYWYGPAPVYASHGSGFLLLAALLGLVLVLALLRSARGRGYGGW